MSKVLSHLGAKIRRLSRLAGGFSGIIAFFLIGVMIQGVIARYVFRSPKAYSVELPVVLFSAMIAFCLAEAQRHGSHVRAELLVQKLSAKAQRILAIIAYFLTVGYSAIVVWAVWQRTGEFFTKHTATISARLPLSPFGVAIIVGVSLLALQAIVQAIELLKIRQTEPDKRKET